MKAAQIWLSLRGVWDRVLCGAGETRASAELKRNVPRIDLASHTAPVLIGAKRGRQRA